MPQYILLRSLLFTFIAIIPLICTTTLVLIIPSLESAVLFYLGICTLLWLAEISLALYIFIPQLDRWLLCMKQRYKQGRIAAITFDDGPDKLSTARVLDILRQEKIPATFFVIGEKAEQNPGLIKRMLTEGHDVGIHTWSHKTIITLKWNGLRRDLERSAQLFFSITQQKPTLFRAPHGFRLPFMKSILKNLGLSLIPWTKGIWDTDGADANELVRRFKKRVRSFEILLLHDGADPKTLCNSRNATIEALSLIIDEYRQGGYRFVKISEL